ncbi:oligosaccharide flippase family protein [Acinetobacter radioresistens]|uniref:oligosaccharide flippase family protein n=1 Tax=Acinetobacter radioresistens TaxID=40216 RepID=UPI000C325A68|nr:oligosaccharide flippase family protein [Acinetobacter radioresistens]MCK4081109.1 oligosaccharide flippase family protein [Acinetobacter radioresistens]PKH31681.1 flippase [Acinetobacter radioresistens]
MLSNFKVLKKRSNVDKDRKALVSNFGYLTILQIASYIFPLLTMPYLARVIGVDGFGKIAFAAAVMVWVQTVVDWGFNYTATRDLAQNRDNSVKVSEIFSTVLWAKLFLMIFMSLLIICLTYTIPFFSENKAILFASFLVIPGQILLSDWFFQALERMKFITIFSLISKFIFTGCIFIFIKEKEDFILQPILYGMCSMIVGFFAIYKIVYQWKVKIIKPNFHIIKIALKNSFDVFINSLLPNLYNSFSIVLLGIWGGSIANGIYDAGRKFIGISHSFMAIFIRVFFPYLSRNIEKHSIFAKIHLSIAALGSVILFVTAPYLIKLFFNEDFYEAITVLRISSISIFLIALSNVYGTNYLIIKGYTKELRNITFIYSLLGFVVAIPLVYFFSYIGANITLVFIQALLGLTIMLKAMGIQNKELSLNKGK